MVSKYAFRSSRQSPRKGVYRQTRRAGAVCPTAWRPCRPSGVQWGGDAPARTRALTIAAFAWTVLPLWVRRQTQWHASLMRARGSARPRVRPQRPQETGRAAAVGNGGRLTRLLPRAARHGSPPRALGSYAL